MNARGIPTVAYQVLHLLSCTRWGTPHGWDTPLAMPEGVPKVGYPSAMGCSHPGLITWGGVPPARVPPSQVWWEDTQGGVPPIRPGWGNPPIGPGWGTPPPVWTWPGYPLGVNRLKILPSLILHTQLVKILEDFQKTCCISVEFK